MIKRHRGMWSSLVLWAEAPSKERAPTELPHEPTEDLDRREEQLVMLKSNLVAQCKQCWRDKTWLTGDHGKAFTPLKRQFCNKSIPPQYCFWEIALWNITTNTQEAFLEWKLASILCSVLAQNPSCGKFLLSRGKDDNSNKTDKINPQRELTDWVKKCH